MIKISSNIKKECSKKYTRILIKMYLMQHQEFVWNKNSEKKNKTFYLWAMEKKGLWLWVKG